MRPQKPAGQQKLAYSRIEELFRQAKESDDAALSRRYVLLARKIAMKYKVKLNAEQKRQSCKKCNAYLIAGKNSTVRLSNGKLVVRCLECGQVRRLAYRRKKDKN